MTGHERRRSEWPSPASSETVSHQRLHGDSSTRTVTTYRCVVKDNNLSLQGAPAGIPPDIYLALNELAYMVQNDDPATILPRYFQWYAYDGRFVNLVVEEHSDTNDLPRVKRKLVEVHADDFADIAPAHPGRTQWRDFSFSAMARVREDVRVKMREAGDAFLSLRTHHSGADVEELGDSHRVWSLISDWVADEDIPF